MLRLVEHNIRKVALSRRLGVLRIDLKSHTACRGRFLAEELLVILIHVPGLSDPLPRIGSPRFHYDHLDMHEKNRRRVLRETLWGACVPDVDDSLSFGERMKSWAA